MRKVLISGAATALACIGIAVATPAPAHADGCGNVGSYGSCDTDYASDGSHEHCDYFWAPFVGYGHNCYWVNTRP
jgi:hypothetical protein